MLDVAAALEEVIPFERDLLVVLALAEDGELLDGQWLRAADRAGLAGMRTPRLDQAELVAVARALALRGALAQGGASQAHALAEAWLAPVLADAHARGRLQPISDRLAEAGTLRAVPTLGRLGDARVALALGDFALFDFAVKRTLWSRSEPEHDPIWVRVLGLHPSAAWLDTIGPRYRSYYLRGALDRAFRELLLPSSAVFDAAERAARDEPELAARLALLLAACGNATRALALSAGSSHHLQYARAFAELVAGDVAGARRDFVIAPRAARSLPAMVPFALLVGLTNPDADLAALKEQLDQHARKPTPWAFAMAALSDFAMVRAGRERPASVSAPHGSWPNFLLPALTARYRAAPIPFELAALERAARSEGYHWVAEQLADLRRGAPSAASLGALWSHREPWELALEALRPAPREALEDAADGHIVWELRPSSWDDSLGVTPRWVRAGASRGKEIPLARFESGELAPVEPTDRAIVAALISAKQKRVRLGRRQLALFVDHPRVVSASGQPVRVQARTARLIVENDGQEATLRLDPPAFDDTGALVLEEPELLTLVQQTPETERIARILGGSSLRIPSRGLAQLGALLEDLGPSVTVHTRGALKHGEEAADGRLHVQLTRSVSGDAIDGLLVRFCVIPRAGGAELAVGEPPELLVAPSGSGLASVRRNLAGERRALEALHQQCPSLQKLERDGADLRADLETGLAILAELAALQASAESFPRIVVSWRSKPLRLATIAGGGKQVRFALRGNTRWLQVEGEVSLGDGRLLAMRVLLEAMDHARGRFVQVSPGEYVALESSLREALENLALARKLGARGQLPLALTQAVVRWTDGFDTRVDASLAARLGADATAEPPVPQGLLATLRDYQREGFAFLARRAAAGCGAVLADDMGLGKTVQALALLLARAEDGPALVVAPTSVLHNWQSELQRFAPSLRGRRLADVDAAGPGEVVLTSYGLLAAHAARFAGRRWSTLIFDEAHALKNPATLRWKAARSLNADACVALTGTPVENHVGELHALFDLIEPGMLGSRATFRRMIAIPMARGERRPASMLRRIVRPVILRRTKSEVLAELPPKTEMVRLVSASADHRAFYEAVRLRAVERARAAKQNQHQSGKARIELLAELTRLRRAAIDPRLVGGPSAPAGSKLDALVHIVRELRDEGHRALVFSQFLEVLDFAGARLEQDGVRCLRLDGTMTAAARGDVIAAFQRGEADLLLASLKAGGVGVNLTAADFVIHLDPWWNPAVEDQATDRTHRLGQSRPVTVLRLCTEHTIEEKVLALHADKRRLYDDVIGEADGAPLRWGRPDEIQAALTELLA